MKFSKQFVIVMTLMVSAGFGQVSNPKFNLEVSATVVDFLEMITISDIDVGTVVASEDVLRLDPRTDQGAGLIKIEGRQNSSIQIAYSGQVEMVNLTTNSSMTVTYTLSGNGANAQSASQLFTTNPETVVLDDKGEFFIWIGCSFSLLDLAPGQYDGDFVVEVDYN